MTTHRQAKDPKVTEIVDQNLVKQLLTETAENRVYPFN